MNHTILFAKADETPLPLILLVIGICVVIFGLLAIGGVLVVRDTIRQRGNWGVNLKPARCVECGTPPPTFRKPANRQQMLWGGWTCAECGLELDKYGRPLENQETLAKFAVLKAAREADKSKPRGKKTPSNPNIREINDRTKRDSTP